MFFKLLLIFILVPIAEVYAFIQVGSLIGPVPTVALVLLTGIAGAYLARVQGLDLLFRVQAELAAGRLPAEELLDGALILAGALLLLTPGFFTDLFGFLLLVPGSRRGLKRYLRAWLQRQLAQGNITFTRYR